MLLQTLVLRVLHRERRLSTGSVTQFCFDRIQDASTEDVDTAIDNATEQKNRARVAKYLCSMKAATGETMSLDAVATYWKDNRHQTPDDFRTEEETSTWDSFPTRKDTDNTKQKPRSDGRHTVKTEQKHFEKRSKQNGRVWCESRQ